MYIPPQALSCESKSCCEGNCSIDLVGKSKAVRILNLDRLKKVTKKTGRISDCAILWMEKDIFTIVELKGGQSKVTIDKAVEQIQAGANLIDSLTKDQHIADFFPVLMYQGPDPTKALGGKIVECRGIKRKVIPRKCGEKISTIPGL